MKESTLISGHVWRRSRVPRGRIVILRKPGSKPTRKEKESPC